MLCTCKRNRSEGEAANFSWPLFSMSFTLSNIISGGLTSDSGNVALENGKVWVLQQETQHGRQLNDQRIPEINI
ncbi:MAG: hypothetical protein ACOX0T_07475 [Pelotomaculum sp.]